MNIDYTQVLAIINASDDPPAALNAFVAQEASLADQAGWTRGLRWGLRDGWDEGYLRGTLDTTSDLEPADNPYRDASESGPA
jgi:hypothetical protein